MVVDTTQEDLEAVLVLVRVRHNGDMNSPGLQSAGLQITFFRSVKKALDRPVMT